MIRLRRRLPFEALATTVGAGVVVVGRPLVENQGQLHVGDGAVIVARPGLTHLAVGPGATMRIGRRAVIGQGAALAALDRLEIGDGVVLGSFVMAMDSDFHVIGDPDELPEPRPVAIGEGARIGHRAVVLPGVTIGAGAIVDAGAVVTRSVPDGAHVAGTPAAPVDARPSTTA
jgi:acetyltransferase-like isoleucine patch superfamily enzyme